MAGEFNATQAAGLLTTYISKTFVPALERDLVLQKFTVKAIIPPGMGKQGRVVTFSNPPATTTALGDGTIGNAVDITASGTSITISEYGEYMHIPSVEEYASVPGMRDEVSARFAHGGMVCIDSLVNTQAQTMTNNVYQCSGSSDGAKPVAATAVATTMNTAAIIACRKKLKDGFCAGFRGIEGHPEGHFAAIIGEQAELDLVTEQTTGRIYWSNAVVNVPGKMGQDKFVNGYIGSVYGVAVYASQNISTGLTVSSTNVTGNLILAQGCMAAVAFVDMKADVFINTPSGNSTDNPFRNFASAAWYARFGTKLNDGVRGVKLYSAGS